MGQSGKRHSKLLIAVRAHQHPEFVLDEVDSIFYYITSTPHVVVAIDRGHNNDPNDQRAIAALVQKHYPQVGVYCATRRWGWGAGMYGLLSATIKWAKLNYSFDHFLSLDYDALFIDHGADARLIADAESAPDVGLVGTVTTMGKSWLKMFKRKWDQIMTMTRNRQPEEGWEKAAVYGAVMLITKKCLATMSENGFFDPPFSNTVDSIKISDDPWLTFLVRLLGYTVVDNRKYCYNVWRSPELPEKVLAEEPGIQIFHPAKMGPGGRGPYKRVPELRTRNWLRTRRNRKPLK